MLQDEALNLLLETCGGTRMGHILLTLPYIRSAADRQLIQVNSLSYCHIVIAICCYRFCCRRKFQKGVAKKNFCSFFSIVFFRTGTFIQENHW